MRVYSVANVIIRKFNQQNHVNPFSISINIIRKRLSAIGRKKSVGPDDILWEILKLGGEAMILYLARLLDIKMKNNAIHMTGRKL